MTSPLRTCVRSSLALALALALAGCPDKEPAAVPDAAPPAAIAPTAPGGTATTPSIDAAPAAAQGVADAGKDATEPRRYDPKYKCPTGQTHFYLEGDFCRKKCFSNSDCAKGERCSAMEYPFLLDGGPAGSGRFCEM
jgi:hypothetical protein